MCKFCASPRSAELEPDLNITTVLGRKLFSIEKDSSVNPSDLSKMLVKKQMKYFDQCHLFVHNFAYLFFLL